MSLSNPDTIARRYLTAEERRRVLEAYGHRCAECNTASGPLHFDHHRALCRGGDNALDNFRPLCLGCHGAKTARDLAEAAKTRRLALKHGRPLAARGGPSWPARPFRHPRLRRKVSGQVVER